MSVVWFLLLWGFVGYMLYTKWQRMRGFERKRTIAAMKEPRFIFSVGFLFGGFFLTSVAGIFQSGIVYLIGMLCMVIGAVVLAVLNWRKNRSFSYFLLAIVGLVSFVTLFG
ncbi:hypothetical protein [Caryophanon tenue]|uniref:DUF3325 domain-containing protein n=1 Tax=Caryophanon tenue TaxID=33978 RepID=A0A1C0Y7B7_9BACL|nr:hypothetical protein [Caryophanon tenue]OCS83056.1 hypothetical protein A6M13_06545 [Caryophanon tenue]